MSFWSFVGNIAPTLIGAGTTLYGASQAKKADNKATQQLLEAQQQASAQEQEAIRLAQARLIEQQQQASPGLTGLQEIIGRGARLNPEQQRSIDDARRRSLDALQGGSLRGSARATAATVADVEGRMRDQYMTSNQSRADQAASNLSGQYFNAGQNIADLNLRSGSSASSGLTNMGNITAANTVGTAARSGEALGHIGALIADEIKQAARNTSPRPTNYGSTPVGTGINWNSERVL